MKKLRFEIWNRERIYFFHIIYWENSKVSHRKVPQFLYITHVKLLQTWLKVFPLYIPTIDPTISGTMIMFRKWVLTISGFSFGGASFFARRSFFTRAIGLRFRPRANRRRARACINSMSCSLELQINVIIKNIKVMFSASSTNI